MKLYPNELSFLLQSRVPLEIWGVLGIILCIGLVSIFSFVKSKERRRRYTGVLCLMIYVFIVLCNTLIFRSNENTSMMVLIPFWSYIEAVKECRMFYLIENLLNIVLFVPIGLLLKMVFPNARFVKILTLSLLLSILIETSQLLLHRGWFELDDMMHNSLGAVLGYIIIRKRKESETQ